MQRNHNVLLEYQQLEKTLKPPYLSKQEIKSFMTQFNLLDNEISLSKLREVIARQPNNPKQYYCLKFIDELRKKYQLSIHFELYFAEMTSFFQEQPQKQMLTDLLGQNQNAEISAKTIKEILQETLGREIYPAEMSEIMKQLNPLSNGNVSIDKLFQSENSQN